MTQVYREQWLECAEVLRKKAKEVEDLAKVAPSRNDQPLSDRDVYAHQDDILINIEDGKRITKAMLKKLPPWRARVLAHIAERAGCPMEVTHEEVRAEARRVGGEGVLWP